MKADVLLGLQWGDEGKGKIVDFLAPQYQVVTRFQGGPNAGHTLEFDGIKHVLHQIPSGIFRPNIKNVIGNGVVLDPVVFKKEVEGLSRFDLNVRQNLFLSKKTQIIVPTHRLLDAAYEQSKGEEKIGSTLKGIGPAYQDKVARLGLRLGDVLLPSFREKYRKLTKLHLDILKPHHLDMDLDTLEQAFFRAIEYLKDFRIVESEYLINDELNANHAVLAEGAQGTLLDVDFGSYPFVTSSNTTTAGACTGLGIAPKTIGEVYGIFKAYCTRVGSGPFPTELHDDTGELMRKEGCEFGATTGRPRRCGWLDLPALKYAVMLNGVTQLFMMKADVLNIFKEIKVCTHYKGEDGTISEMFPYDLVDKTPEPVYKVLKGWYQSLDAVKDFDQLPVELHEYISFIEDSLGVPVNIVSTGPDRKQTLLKNTILV